MGTLEEFETAYKEAVCAKRLSGSKVTNLTEMVMTLMKDDTKLVAGLYRMHKALPSSAKVSSLYAIDALARAARSRATKKKLTGDMSTVPGNCATFLLKLDGILDGFFEDVISSTGSEGKEKAKKVLDIWTKAGTFSSGVLSRLTNVVKAASEGVGNKGNSPPAAPADAIRPSSISTPPVPAPGQAPTGSAGVDPALQATLLALLTQVQNSTTSTHPVGVNTGPLTLPNVGQPGLNLPQQSSQNSNVASALPSSHPSQHSYFTGHSATPLHPPGQSYSSDNRRDPRRSHANSPPHEHDGHDYSNNRMHPIGDRGGLRGRGRGGWTEGRSGDRFSEGRQRDDTDHRRNRSSRSRSPPSRYSSGRGRDVKPYNPPHRPSLKTLETSSAEPPSNSVAGKDEFGRDIRASASPLASHASAEGSPRSPRRPSAPQIVQAKGDKLEPPTSTPNDSSSSNAIAPSQATPAVGLESINIFDFDFSEPASWEAVGKAWQVTHGTLPSQEQLMEFVMGTIAMANQAAMMYGWMGQAGWDGGEYSFGMEDPTMGIGGNGFASQGGGYPNGNVRNQEQWGPAMKSHGQDPGGHQSDEAQNVGGDSTSGGEQVGSKGSMQRVGDKWVFVRANAS